MTLGFYQTGGAAGAGVGRTLSNFATSWSIWSPAVAAAVVAVAAVAAEALRAVRAVSAAGGRSAFWRAATTVSTLVIRSATLASTESNLTLRASDAVESAVEAEMRSSSLDMMRVSSCLRSLLV